ncbi:MAG: DNA polymerase III subunit delta [Alphaproteobacteria bacterium]|nr:DNA polymerase III subunit delta [Alphaproteobacteria bacterium]
MKIAPARIEAFLRKPDAALRAALIFGPDLGLVRERADAIARSVVADATDPFRISELDAADLAADPPRLADEAAAMCMTGGRRVVRVRGADDRVADVFAQFLEDPPGDALIVVEASDLARRSKLCAAFEAARLGVAIPCYVADALALAAAAKAAMTARGLKATDDAAGALAALLGPDRMLLGAEVEKLALYAGSSGAIDLDDVLACTGDAAETSVDDAIDAALSGDRAGADRALRRLAAEGEAPVRVLRGLARHLLRLGSVQARVESGEPLESVLRSLRPPLFFKRAPAFRRQLQTWRGDRLAIALSRATQAELRCKETGQPGRLICERLFVELTARAGRFVSGTTR